MCLPDIASKGLHCLHCPLKRMAVECEAASSGLSILEPPVSITNELVIIIVSGDPKRGLNTYQHPSLMMHTTAVWKQLVENNDIATAG